MKNTALSQFLREVVNDPKLLKTFEGIGNQDFIGFLSDFKKAGEQSGHQISLDEMVKLFDDYNSEMITEKELFGDNMCSRGTDGGCSLTTDRCGRTGPR